MSEHRIHLKNVAHAGAKLENASKAMIMIHGRGGNAEDILSLANHLNVKGFALLAPQASNNSWYPYSFMAPISQNEPWLGSALSVIKETVNDVIAKGVSEENIYFCGFSQGACLTLEFVARNATKYGGVVAFTGGLIGNRIDPKNYKGDFKNTPVFIGSSNPDPHVPVERVNETTKILTGMNARVTEKIYTNMGHTITENEIDLANELVFNVSST
ncbi:MAG: alpha/beta hydrolase [Ginsengibacter sp.]